MKFERKKKETIFKTEKNQTNEFRIFD